MPEPSAAQRTKFVRRRSPEELDHARKVEPPICGALLYVVTPFFLFIGTSCRVSCQRCDRIHPDPVSVLRSLPTASKHATRATPTLEESHNLPRELRNEPVDWEPIWHKMSGSLNTGHALGRCIWKRFDDPARAALLAARGHTSSVAVGATSPRPSDSQGKEVRARQHVGAASRGVGPGCVRRRSGRCVTKRGGVWFIARADVRGEPAMMQARSARQVRA